MTIEKQLTLPEMDNAKDSIREVQSMLTEAKKKGGEVPQKLVLGIYHAECIIHDYRRLFLIE